MSLIDNEKRRFLAAYAHAEDWEGDHDLAMMCRDAEEWMARGIRFFRAMTDQEADLQRLQGRLPGGVSSGPSRS